MKNCTCNCCLERLGRQVLINDLTEFADSLKPIGGVQLEAESVDHLVFLLEHAAEVIKDDELNG